MIYTCIEDDSHEISCPIFIFKLEDLKVLRRSPDLLNNVRIGQGQLQLIMEQILFFTIYILVKWPKQSDE